MNLAFGENLRNHQNYYAYSEGNNECLYTISCHCIEQLLRLACTKRDQHFLTKSHFTNKSFIGAPCNSNSSSMIYIYEYRSTLPRECDIIWVIKQYFLCVMTQGSDNAIPNQWSFSFLVHLLDVWITFIQYINSKKQTDQ